MTYLPVNSIYAHIKAFEALQLVNRFDNIENPNILPWMEMGDK